jgi:RNA polymerase-binding transcription factor DksA
LVKATKQKRKPAKLSRPVRPAPAKAKNAVKRPAPKAPANSVKAAKPAAKVAAKPVKAVPVPKPPVPKPRAAPVPKPIPILPVRVIQAPAKFRREYRRWRDLLISLRHRLLQEGSHLEEEGLKALEQEVSVDHMADFGSDSSEQETTLQLIESNSLSMRDVDDALKRIDAGSYGLCEDCEQLIPTARLSVLPHARFCISCQSKREGMLA